MASPTAEPDSTTPRYERTVPLVSRRLAVSVALTSVPVLLVVTAFTLLENDPLWIVAVAAAVLLVPPFLLTRLRLAVELRAGQLRYRLHPWHRRPRILRVDSITGVERFSRRPNPEPRLRRINLGRGWVDWDDDEVRYVLGEEGVRLVRESGRTVELWFDGVDELALALDEVRRHRGW